MIQNDTTREELALLKNNQQMFGREIEAMKKWRWRHMTMTFTMIVGVAVIFFGVSSLVSPLMFKTSSIEDRMTSIEVRVTSIEGRLDTMETRMDSLDTRMDSLDTRMDSLETRMEDGFNQLNAAIGQVLSKFETHQLSALIQN